MKARLLQTIFSFWVLLTVGLIFSTAFFSYEYLRINDKYSELKDEFDSLRETRLVDIEQIEKNQKKEIDGIRAIEPKPKNVSDLFTTGWIADWDIPAGTESLKNNPNFDGISPVFFWVNEDGSLKETTYMNDQNLLTYASLNNIELIPTITLFDEEILTSVLNNKENFNRHVQQIINQVVNNDYDGIDIDYESIYLEDKELYFDLLEKLATELTKRDKKLSVTVMPKWGDQIVYGSLPQTRMVQDYKRISDLADEVRIMTYEFSGRQAKEVYGIAPIDWMEDIIRYAIYVGVPRQKLILGIHTYSYNFSERPIAKDYSYYPIFFPGTDTTKPDGLANFPVQTFQIISDNNAQIKFNERWGEAFTEYTNASGEKRIMIFPDQRTIDLRKDLAAKYGLRGVSYWKVGSEAPLKL